MDPIVPSLPFAPAAGADPLPESLVLNCETEQLPDGRTIRYYTAGASSAGDDG